ncbi:MAG: DUF177 domain-containing protein [Clostridia bacterium]|nr:DUF177 domain-containing protein [Clostridia bacterium]
MLLHLQSLFVGDQKILPFETTCDLSSLEISDSRPFRRPVTAQGEVVSAAGIVTLRLSICSTYEGDCDRCMTPFSREDRLHVEYTLVTSLNNEESDGYLLVENFTLSLDELVETEVLLALPSKNLCRKTCRGLCALCGKNLNEGDCDCQKQTVDPRLEKLRQLLE